MPIRSAPFSITVPANNNVTRQVVRGGEQNIYRFFNSTDRTDPLQKKFKLQNTSDSGAYVDVPQDLHATMSIDIAVGPTDNATARPAGIVLTAVNGLSTAEIIQGSFDLLRDSDGVRSSAPSRSGRFNFPTRVANGFLPVMLIDLSFAPISAIYRFGNTGDNSFEIFIAENKTATKVVSVPIAARQAMDIEISHTAARRVFVARSTAGQHIRGVFELVG